MDDHRPSRETLRTVVIFITAAVLAAALVRRYHSLGGPYFEFPKTVQDHVAPTFYPSRDAILLAAAAAEIIPRGATVTAIQPSQAPDYDVTLYMTAAGMMPRHRIIPPALTANDPAALPQYVLAVREPFTNPHYRLFREIPEGRIYEVVR
ncbi:MAG TPA: hypothetical protein VHX14_20515 [Thermoanaerobaculia bacterium]|jgi:hypothetical protein|nr:hypothetical protein [Thermoanaerobaculia bacterium]